MNREKILFLLRKILILSLIFYNVGFVGTVRNSIWLIIAIIIAGEFIIPEKSMVDSKVFRWFNRVKVFSVLIFFFTRIGLYVWWFTTGMFAEEYDYAYADGIYKSSFLLYAVAALTVVFVALYLHKTRKRKTANSIKEELHEPCE
ncbi:MAG: hypothetical protein FWD34_02670 [Oscillospiraceae bacterium]|nr:hypothetical protein [Oscillospiraceae bacterium]